MKSKQASKRAMRVGKKVQLYLMGLSKPVILSDTLVFWGEE